MGGVYEGFFGDVRLFLKKSPKIKLFFRNDEIEEDVIQTPQPPMINATQDLLNRLLETTLIQHQQQQQG